MRLSAETVQAHGRYDFRYTNGIYDTTATRENADIESYRFEAALYGEKSFQHWNVKYYHFSSERGLPGAVVANRFMHPQRLWDESDFIQGEFQQHITPNYTLTFRSKFGKDYSRYLDPEIITTAFPPLAGSDYLNEDVKRAIEIVQHGLTGEITVNGEIYNSVMPPQNLSDQDVASVLTYIYNNWGNNKTEVTTQMVDELRE